MSYLGRAPTGSILTGADIADGSISTDKLANLAVSTAKVADDAIENTKLNLASDYAFTGTITGASDITKITTVDGAGASEIDFSGNLGSFNYNMIVFKDLQTAGDVSFKMRFFHGGSIATNSGHRYAGKMRSSTGNDSNQNSDNDTGFDIMNAIDDSSSGAVGSTGVIYIPHTTTSYMPAFFGNGFQQSHNGNKNAIYYAGHNTGQTSAISGVRLYPSSGNFTNIKATLYGVN
tara:strand:- start:150 stop:848 length:699 start_codon:yes stop_codon:yes gene_type:complete